MTCVPRLHSVSARLLDEGRVHLVALINFAVDGRFQVLTA